MSVYADLLRYRELFGSLFRRDLRARYKGTIFGVAWSLVNPLVLAAIYVLVFSLLWQVENIEHYPLFLLCGLSMWLFVSSSLTGAARSMLDYAELIKKVRFPRQLTAFSTVAAHLVALVAILVILIPVNLMVIPETRETIWLTIPLMIPIVALVAGLSLVVAAGNVLFRDIEHIVAALLLPWFFLTPIMYSFQAGGFLKGSLENHQTLIQFLHYANPITPPIETIHDVLFWGQLPHWGDVVYTLGAAAVALALGAWVFRRVDDRIAVEL